MRLRALLALTLLLALVPLRSNAGTPDDPEVVDAVSDANFVNGQGQVGGLENGPGTNPGSQRGADYQAIWFETTWHKDGFATVIDGVNVKIRTSAPVSPTFGPGLVYRVPVSIDGCDFNIEMWVAGQTQNTPLERAPRANLSLLRTVCPGGGGDVTVPVTHQGNITTISIPFAVVDASAHKGLFADGKTMRAFGTARPHVRVQLGATLPVVDETVQPRSFTIGSDVPV